MHCSSWSKEIGAQTSHQQTSAVLQAVANEKKAVNWKFGC